MEQTEAELRHILEKRLRCEALLAEISARFVNLPTDQIDGIIEDAQRRICECLGLDLSALWQWAEETPRFLTVTHLHSPPEGPSRPEGIDAQEAFPWVLQKMLRGETFAYSTEDMPPEAAHNQEMRRHFGIKSSVNIPLSTGGGPIMGVLTFDTLRAEHAWPEETVEWLTLIAQVFANALERKRSEEALLQSEKRLNLAAVVWHEFRSFNYIYQKTPANFSNDSCKQTGCFAPGCKFNKITKVPFHLAGKHQDFEVGK